MLRKIATMIVSGNFEMKEMYLNPPRVPTLLADWLPRTMTYTELLRITLSYIWQAVAVPIPSILINYDLYSKAIEMNFIVKEFCAIKYL